MRGRIIISLVAVVSALLIFSAMIAAGLVDVSRFSLNSTSVGSGAGPTSTASVFVTPSTVIDSRLQGTNASTFVVRVNVSDVTDLFSFQLNVTYNPAILRVNRISAGDLLLRTGSASKTAAYQLGYVINSTDNVKGYSSMADTILGGVPGQTGAGSLVDINFTVVDYGYTSITVSVGSRLPTTMLNSAMGAISFTTVNGYFKNTIAGDANGDTKVNSLDIGTLNAHWAPASGTPPWSLGYSRDVDVSNDGQYINSLDIGVVNANWGKTFP